MSDPGLELLETRVERVLGWREGSAHAVVLEREGKRFLIFVGPFEGAAVKRELAEERAERPLTHDLLDNVLKGFDVSVAKVVVSALVNEVFCATITLVRDPGEGEPRTEVRLDARASDAVVVALKAKAPLYVTRRVFDAVSDMTEQVKKLEAAADLAESSPSPEFEGHDVVGVSGVADEDAESDDDVGDEEGLGGSDDVDRDEPDDDAPNDDDASADEDDDRDRPLKGPPS
jgi:uncharacterized protein